METTGRIADVSREYTTNKVRITFVIDSVPSDLDSLKGELDIIAKKHREKRSLNANSYFHLLCSRIADKNGESLTEAKNKLLAEWGQPDTEIGTIILLDSIDWTKVEPLHLRPSKATKTLDNGKLYRVYWVMRGSHTYSTKDMSRLIDGTVEAAKELGIETLTPNELERMKAAWTLKS